ncbi:hypothetical protein GWK47_009115 [Chionoecetes opilio]|uniref:Uncharacterized protein n=1 Tax=Chionoecetes opilio TaxID=41210 RepID=A0A8J5C423_CHIOP|nr:hypothetical protein GWK47_009115 [Chionoecetes opilio]
MKSRQQALITQYFSNRHKQDDTPPAVVAERDEDDLFVYDNVAPEDLAKEFEGFVLADHHAPEVTNFLHSMGGQTSRLFKPPREFWASEPPGTIEGAAPSVLKPPHRGDGEDGERGQGEGGGGGGFPLLVGAPGFPGNYVKQPRDEAVPKLRRRFGEARSQGGTDFKTRVPGESEDSALKGGLKRAEIQSQSPPSSPQRPVSTTHHPGRDPEARGKKIPKQSPIGLRGRIFNLNLTWGREKGVPGAPGSNAKIRSYRSSSWNGKFGVWPGFRRAPPRSKRAKGNLGGRATPQKTWNLRKNPEISPVCWARIGTRENPLSLPLWRYGGPHRRFPTGEDDAEFLLGVPASSDSTG